MENKVGIKQKEDSKLEEIVTLEERKKQYAEWKAEEEKTAKEKRLEREQKQREYEEKRAKEEAEKAALE